MELIKQHRITASQRTVRGLPVVIVNYQIGVHLFYLFSNQAKLRDFLRIDLGLVAERDRFEHEDGLPRPCSRRQQISAALFLSRFLSPLIRPISLFKSIYWRRGELNPCPRSGPRRHLHVYPVVRFKEPNVAPARCRLPSVREIPSPPGAVTPPNDYPAVHVWRRSRRPAPNVAVN